MSRGCTPGLVRDWRWFDWPEERLPEEGDIAIRQSTGSCWLVVGRRKSPRRLRWYILQMEGLGTDAAEVGDEGVFPIVSMSYENLKLAEQIEEMERAGTELPA